MSFYGQSAILELNKKTRKNITSGNMFKAPLENKQSIEYLKEIAILSINHVRKPLCFSMNYSNDTVARIVFDLRNNKEIIGVKNINSVQIYDMKKTMVLDTNFNQSQKPSININKLISGKYIMLIRNDKEVFREKFIKP